MGNPRFLCSSSLCECLRNRRRVTQDLSHFRHPNSFQRLSNRIVISPKASSLVIIATKNIPFSAQYLLVILSGFYPASYCPSFNSKIHLLFQACLTTIGGKNLSCGDGGRHSVLLLLGKLIFLLLVGF